MAQSTSTTFERARSPEQKQQRRDSIREAARELAVRDGVRNVTLAMIAERVGLAASNVLAYFGTRDEIYLDLLGETWTDWTESLEAAFEGLPAESGMVARAVADTLAARPLFCDLVAYIAPSYEYKVSPEAVRRSSMIGIGNSARFGALFTALFSLTEQQVFDLNCSINSFIAWWWMRSHPSANVALGQEPTGDVTLDFATGVERWIKTFLDGLLAQGLPSSTRPLQTGARPVPPAGSSRVARA